MIALVEEPVAWSPAVHTMPKRPQRQPGLGWYLWPRVNVQPRRHHHWHGHVHRQKRIAAASCAIGRASSEACALVSHGLPDHSDHERCHAKVGQESSRKHLPNSAISQALQSSALWNLCAKKFLVFVASTKRAHVVFVTCRVWHVLTRGGGDMKRFLVRSAVASVGALSLMVGFGVGPAMANDPLPFNIPCAGSTKSLSTGSYVKNETCVYVQARVSWRDDVGPRTSLGDQVSTASIASVPSGGTLTGRSGRGFLGPTGWSAWKSF